jgi:hypothetical protein
MLAEILRKAYIDISVSHSELLDALALTVVVLHNHFEEAYYSMLNLIKVIFAFYIYCIMVCCIGA